MAQTAEPRSQLLGLAWLIMVGLLHLNHGTNGHAYGPLVFDNTTSNGYAVSALTVLTAALQHPVRAMRILWSNHVDAWANLSPTGLLGLFWLPVLPPLLLILGEGQLASESFAAPGFQNLAIVSLAAVGTVGMCSAIAGSRFGRKRWVLPALTTVLAANAVVWAVVWLPRIGATWLRVTPSAAATLKSIESKIGPQDEVVASQGISGGLSYHPSCLLSVFADRNGPDQGGQGLDRPGTEPGHRDGAARRRVRRYRGADHPTLYAPRHSRERNMGIRVVRASRSPQADARAEAKLERSRLAVGRQGWSNSR